MKLTQKTRKIYQYVKQRELNKVAVDPKVYTMAVTSVVQEKLDAFARSKNYDGILSACSYSNSTLPVFEAEGAKCILLRDQTWAKCYEIMADVTTGKRSLPKIDDLLAELPVLAWE